MADDMIHIRCTGLVELRNKDGRYGLLINRGELKEGHQVLTPVGGGIVATKKGITYLHNLGATQFEENTLRFKLPKHQLPSLVKWFTKRIDRELTPEREMNEELIDENKLLTSADLQGNKIKFIGYGYRESISTYPNQSELTVRLMEIFSVKLSPVSMDKLIRASQLDNAIIHFATSKEITSGITIKGVKIGSNSKSLLSPSPTIPFN